MPLPMRSANRAAITVGALMARANRGFDKAAMP